MIVTAIDTRIDEAIVELKKAYDEIEKRAENYTLFPREISLSSEPFDFYKACYEIAETIRQLEILRAAHRFYKIDDVMKRQLFEKYLSNEEGKVIIITETYTVSDVDTWQSIQEKFGIEWRKIAEYNKLESVSLRGGQEIQVPHEYDPEAVRQFFSENPVFDLHEGYRVLGLDLPNELEEDVDGDLKILNYRETFLQGLKNILNTVEGSLPFYPNWGFNSQVGDDIPNEVSKEWRKQKIREALMRDRRIQDVPLDRIVIIQQTEGLTIEIDVLPINNLDFETLTTIE